jgi:DNA-binding LacI/PurR family transcriptional regulator
MLNENCNATAVQTANDLIAIGCANTLMDQGVRIPQNLSIVGFCNILASEFSGSR